MSRKLLTVDDIQGAWAIMPTPAKDNASDWRAQDTVDLEETARAVKGLVDAGINGILSMGTLGECATLTRDEKKAFIATAVEAAGDVPFFAGTTALSTRETIEETRMAYELGAQGTMLGLPMWCACDVPTAVKFYQDVAEAVPGMNIAIYANPMAFRFDFPPPFWAQVSKIPQVVTAKYGPLGRIMFDLGASQKQIRFLPLEMDYYTASRIDPEFFTAFWTSGAVCGPTVATHLRDEMIKAKETGEWTEVKALTDQIVFATMPMFPRGGDFNEFSKYNIGIEKEKMNAAGWMKAGPCRPPYTIVPEAYLEGARKAGQAWAAIEKKLTGK